jgi:Tfp pilus assembly protein PilX
MIFQKGVFYAPQTRRIHLYLSDFDYFFAPGPFSSYSFFRGNFHWGFRNMKTPAKTFRKKHRGIAMIIAMVFVVIFSAISIGFLSLSSANTQVSVNHRDGNNALAAAQSGLDCAMYAIRTSASTPYSTGVNNVNDADAVIMWRDKLYARLVAMNLGSTSITKTGDAVGDTITTGTIPYGNGGSFTIRFTRSNTKEISIESTGIAGGGAGFKRYAGMKINIKKDAKVLNYAIASRGRMWLTGDTTIHGSVYSSWNLSNSQLNQLAALQEQVRIKLTAGTLNSTSFASLISTLPLTSATRTIILNELLAGTLTPVNAAARCIMAIPTASVPSISPLNMTNDSTVLGSINTCWSKGQVGAKSWQFESLDAEGNPIYQTDGAGNVLYETDGSGNYLYDDNGNMIKARVVESDGDTIVETGEDEIQGICAGVNYGEAPQNLAGLNSTDYDTTSYKVMAKYAQNATTSGSLISNGKLPTSGYTTVTEYFPHATSNYSAPRDSGSQSLTRRKYESKTMRNVVVSNNTNALFKNCTFEEVLYIDCSTTGSTNYNNVRFENCTFNGVIVTNTPQTLSSGWWKKNCLYFTGTATFQNNSSIPEATILAPHFNVNLGNTNPSAGENNVLTGAIVGGIVDIRGNAQIFGTIISMADTSAETSGYVTNIGATENDGGSETTEAGDIGTIEITPTPEQLLPSGITTPVIFDPNSTSYSEPRS